MKTLKIDHTGKGGPVRVRKSEINEDTNAAKIAAGILARREFGRRGYCRTLRLDSWAADGSSYTYQAFIGRDDGHGATVGRNIWIYV